MRTISKMMPMLLVVLAAVGCKPEDEARLVAASDDGRLQSEARETVPVATAGGGDVQDGPGEAGPAAARDIGKFQDGLRQAGIWAGGPGFKFEGVGRETLAAAIKYGLDPDHKVLDVGAGSLRVGWWLLHYVEPENYHAIEPVKNRVDTAAAMIGADIHVYYNTDWEFPPVDFDFVIARSIWTHASKWMISKMLAEFADNSAPNARFLASVLPARHPWEDCVLPASVRDRR